MSAVCEIESELNSLSFCINGISKENISKIAKDIYTVFVNTVRETFGMNTHVEKIITKNVINRGLIGFVEQQEGNFI